MVTVISTVPGDDAVGDVAVIVLSEFTVNLVVLYEPKFTDVAPVNPEPVITTCWAPTSGPELGETLFTIGA